MSDYISSVKSVSEIKLLPCPFCGKGFRINCRGVYEHDNENCPLHGLEIGTEEQQKKWNTRKPMERILSRLEEEKDFFKHHELDYGIGCYRTFGKSIQIVKKEGGIE